MADYEKFDLNENGDRNENDDVRENGDKNENDDVHENDRPNDSGDLNENDIVNEDEEINDDDHPNQTADADDDSLFDPIDVSEPRAPLREIDVIEEALALGRRDWIRSNRTYLFAAIGIVVVILIVLLINMIFRSSNPMSRFTASLSKNFNSSFQFDVRLTEDDEPVMSYVGAIDVNRNKHTARAVYEADYNRYQFSGAVYADKNTAKKGSYYQKKWLVRDCLDNAQDFFDFDRDFRSGGFDGGSFLRFTGLTSDFSTRELNAFVNTLMKRLSTDSAVATITSEEGEGEERFHYDISMQALFDMVKNDGASIFYRASDYDAFCVMYERNSRVIADAKCTVDYTVNDAGNMTLLEAKITVAGKAYGMTCRMSDFGEAQVEIPQGFFKAAEIALPDA
ncbi:MAG: hypothetical protein IJG87_05920 [Ruminococcus sp.]|nr:hypothetical protein [Ruminococcus sp.]